jgi:glycosyltransferase involved in cell wall biosynthesis
MDGKNNPTVSVLMPVYNGMPYLPQAVSSIINQTFSDFEFIIVNDGSADGTTSYLNNLNDTRIVLIHTEKNQGLTAALQLGMERAQGKYIARLDADDIALPHRLNFQVAYMERNPEIVLLGTACEVIDRNGNRLKGSLKSLDDLEIRWKMLFKNPFVHSTVMFRSDIIRKHQLTYVLRHGEDYQLWVELLRYGKGIILPEITIQYRVHDSSWTFTKDNEQRRAVYQVAYHLHQQYLSCSMTELEGLISWVRGKKEVGTSLQVVVSYYVSLLASFIKKHRSEVPFTFIKDKLCLLRKRLGWMTFLRWQVLVVCFRGLRKMV